MKVYNPKTKKFEDNEIKQNNTSINVYDPSTQTFGNKVKEPEQNTWLRAGALQDGYQFGDIGKTILGTGADVIHRGVKGIVKTGEGIGDFLGYGAAQVVEGLGNKQYADEMRKAANESLTDKVFAPVDKTLDKNSLLGKKSQGVAESIGQIGAYAATGGVSPKLGTATMFTSAAGSAGNEAYSKENVTNEQAWTKMLAGGAISTATEKAFGLFGKSGLDTAVANKISSKLTKGMSKTLARLGVQATSEALEELMEYTGNQLLDMGIDAMSKGKGAKFHEDWNWEEVGQQMAMAAIASGIVGAGTTALGVKGTPGSNLNEKLNNYAELIDIQEGVKPKEQVKLPGIRTEQSLTNNIEQLKEQQKQTTDNKLKQELATKISGLEQELNQFKLPMASTEGMNLMESASKYNIKPETQSAVQQLMENRGIESRWDATKFSDNSVNALWTKDANGNRSVIFNPNASLDTIVEEVAVHELTHDILSSENTTLNAQEVLDYVSQLDGYNEARQSLENTYSTMYDSNSADFKSLIDEEVVADVLGRKLGNQEFINQLVNSKPSIAKSIYNWVVSKLNSIVNKGKVRSEKLYWQNIKNNFENAYKQEYKNNEMASTKYKVSSNAFSILENRQEYDLGTYQKGISNTDSSYDYNKVYNYDIKNGGKGDNVSVSVSRNGYVWNNALLSDNVKGKGEGTKIALELNKQSLEETGKPLRSLPEYSIVGIKNHTEEGKGLWESLVKKGYAVKNADNTYTMLESAVPENYKQTNITTDNQGRTLSKQQQEYFKDSKVRDDNGNLEVVYHGSQKAEFTKFNRNFNYYTNNENVAQTYSGSQEKVDTRKLESIFDAKSWLKGITNELYIENNSVYDYDGEEILNYQTAEDLLKNLKRDIQIEIGNTEAGGNYEGYINITKPLIVNVNGGKWSAIDINGIELNNPKEFLEKYGSSTFRENGAIRTSTNDIVSAVSDAIDEGELNFDGIIFKNIRDEGGFSNNQKNAITANDYVTFNSNQFKAVDNTNPTTNEDIRYSKENAEWNEFLDKNLKDTGTTGDLMAIHNLNEKKLKGILELGGFPAPSIAITKLFNVGSNQFGDITILFDKSTIDPLYNKNEVYDRDVWTPTFPSVEYDIDNAKIREMAKKNNFYDDTNDEIISNARLNYLYSENLGDLVNRWGIEKALEQMKEDTKLKYLYLKTINNDYNPQMKPKKYSYDYSNKALQEYIDLYNNNQYKEMSLPDFYYHYLNYGDMNLTEDQTKALKATIRDIIYKEYKQEAKQEYKKAVEKGNTGKYNEEQFIDNYVKMMLESYDNSYFKYKDFVRDASKLDEFGETQTIDESETLKKVEKDINQKEYEKWIDDTFGKMLNETEKGIRNNVDLFTPSGNRRSFNQLHDKYNLENVVKLMTSKKTVAGEEGFGSGSGFGTIQAQMSNKFNNIDEIREAANQRIVPGNQEKDLLKPYEDLIYGDMEKLVDYYPYKDDKYSYPMDTIGYALNDFAGKSKQDITNLKKVLKEYSFNLDTIPNEVLNKVVKDVNSLKEISTDYFEAKPQRAVGLDEVQAVVIPNTASNELRNLLQEAGLNYVEYDPNVEGDRNKVINKFDNLKFSKNSPEWNNFVNKHNAPEGTKTKLKDIKLPKKEINLPKSTQVKQETRQEVKLPTRETITKEELEELDSLKALNEITDLSREEQNRLDYLEKKQQGYTERYSGLKKVTDFKEISREYGKYRDLDNFDKTLLRDAESMIKGYRNTERRTKDEWLSIARYIGSNFKGNSEELQKYAIQSWFAAAPNQKGSLNRQGKGFVDFKIQEWINSMYDGARVGELDKPSTPKKQTILPMVREDNVLKVNANEIADFMNGVSGNQRGWAKTATESDVLKDKVLIKDLDASKLNYVVESNQKSIDTANNHLNTYGYEKSLEDVKSLLRSEKLPKASDVALAERVLQEAVRNGDTKTAQDLIMDIAILGTDLGQATQALSIIKRLTPEGQLSMYTKMIQRAKSRGEKSFENVEITPEMVEMVLNAYKSDGTYDQEDLNNRVENFKQEIANQMKTTTGEKINAWRYLAMLGNPKTHIRNIVSNVAMNGTIKVKNAMARTLESVLPIENRTKTWKKASDFIKNYAETTANEMKGIITGENKYNEKSSLESKKRTFKSDTLEKLSNFNSNALEAEDWFFSKRAFKSNLEEYLTANGINTQEDIESRPEVVEKAKNYAKEQAEIATFRQYSKLAAQINNLEKNNKLARFFIEATVPFKKTPINVAKAGVKYSPLGLIKSLSYDIYQVKQGNMEASQLIDNISQGLTGTSLAILGYALAKNGILNGGGDDDKEGKYDTQLGDNQYSLKIGDKSYSISWLSPVAMPLLVGANAFEQLEEKEEWDMNVVSETLAKTLDPLNEMSFMQGLTNALSSYDKGVEKLAGIGESVAQNYVGQFFPTIFSQFASTIDDKKRSTKASANSTYKFGEQTLRSVMYKLPGLRQQLEVATDVWGNEKEQADNIIQRAYESFLAPYSTTKNITSDLDKELKSIYNKTNETGVIPSVPYSYIKYKDETYRMSANEYTKYKKTFGQNANKYLNNLINSNAYKNASDDDKAKMIKNTYDYAKAEANEEYFKSQSIDYTSDTLKELNALKKIGINDKSLSEYISNKTLASTIKSNSQLSANEKHQKIANNFIKSNLNDKQLAYLYGKYYSTDDKLNNLVELNIPIKEFIKLNSQDIESDYNERTGKTISNSKKNKVINYINSLNLSIPQKAILIKSQYKTYKNYDNAIVNYVNNLNKSVNDKKVILKSIGFDNYDNDVINYINSQNMSIKDKEKKLKSLGFTIRNGRVYK